MEKNENKLILNAEQREGAIIASGVTFAVLRAITISNTDDAEFMQILGGVTDQVLKIHEMLFEVNDCEDTTNLIEYGARKATELIEQLEKDFNENRDTDN